MTQTHVTNGSATADNTGYKKDAKGHFGKGNKGGPGGAPAARKRQKWQLALIAAVSVEDMMEVMAVVVAKAKRGDMRAVKELFDRTVGAPAEQEALARIEHLERVAGVGSTTDAEDELTLTEMEAAA